MTHFTHFFRALALCLVTLVCSGAWATVQTYQKVTSAPTDWSGEYLIVYEAGNCTMDGSLTKLDAVSNYQAVTIIDDAISLDDAYSFTIASMDGGYSIQAKSGKYIGNASNSNALTASDNAMKNTLSLSADGDVLIVSAGGAYLRYMATSGQTRFRYYKSSTYTNQKAIHLYKKGSVTPPPTKELVSIAVTGTPDKTSYYVGDAFDTAGLVVTGTYSDASKNEITKDITWTVTPETLALGTTSVSVKANVGDIESSAYTVNGLTVTQKGADVALTTIDQIFAKATEVGKTATEVSVKFDGWYVTGVKGSNAYATDGTKGFIIYGNNHGFAVGDALTGTVTCKVQLYNGSAEITQLTASTEGLTVTPDHAITAVEKTIDQLSGINTGAVVTIKNVTYNVGRFTDGTNTLVPYNTLMTLPAFEENGKYNITGVYLQYNTSDEKKEILPRSEADIEALATTKYTVTWSVNGTTTDEKVTEGAAIDFKPATVPDGFTDYVFRGWTTSETVSGATEPTYVTEATATADITYYAVFAKKTTTGGTASLTKLDGTSTLADGDKLAIFAHVGDNYYGMKHETVSNSYVNYYFLDKEPTYEAVTENDLNWWTLNEKEEGKWTLGDASNGYLVNASSNNLIANGTNTGSSLTIAWDDTNSAFTIKNGDRWIGCRSDLSDDSGNQYKFRGAGNLTSPTSKSSCYLDIYRVSTGTVTYSDWTTTLVKTAYTLNVSQYGYSTLYLDKAVEIPEGVTVYYCTTKDDQSLNAVKIESGYVPAYTGVVVEAKEGTYNFEYTDQQFEKLGILIGVFEDTSVQEIRTNHHNAPVYVLSVVEGTVGFYNYADTATLHANRAFLEGAEEQPPVNGFILDFDMETVGVSSVVNATNLKAGYDLQGRRANNAMRGLLIQNGKKILR